MRSVRRVKEKKIKYLDSEEKKIIESYENEEWLSVKDRDNEIKRYQKIANDYIKKNKKINIRLSQLDLDGIKKKAYEEGIPYQTLISSLIHKYISGKLITK